MTHLKRVQRILKDISCPPYLVEAHGLQSHSDVVYLQAKKWRPDTETNELGWGHGGKYYISEHSTDEEIRQKALAACLAFAEHEVREAFTWKGRRIFGPHLDHKVLWRAAHKTVGRKPRQDPEG